MAKSYEIALRAVERHDLKIAKARGRLADAKEEIAGLRAARRALVDDAKSLRPAKPRGRPPKA